MERDADKLLKKYHAGQCTPAEKQLVEAFLNHQALKNDALPDERRMLESLVNLDTAFKRTVRRPYYRFAMVASLLVFLTAALYLALPGLLDQTGVRDGVPFASGVPEDIAPGGNRAFLTLGNGSTVALSENYEGIVIGDDQIHYEDGSEVITGSGSRSEHTLTLTTPRGGQYQVTLPDGTRVWLNAASTLTYPMRFIGTERRVTLHGEGYFEVATASAPFIVTSPGQEVSVLGTHFNITAYADEKSIKTTLLEGSVRVSGMAAGTPPIVRTLIPGQQSTVTGGAMRVEEVSAGDAIAWKNGLFVFNREPLEQIMQRVSRWYDIDIVYKDEGLRKQLFGGQVSRFSHVSEILEVLQLTGLAHFRVEADPDKPEERRIIVMK